MRLIDGDKLVSIFAQRKEVWRGNGVLSSTESLMWLAAMDITKNVPTIDAVHIIRCKDCANWDTDWTTNPPDHYCPMVDKFTSADFYCGQAEKMEEQDAAD